MGIKTIVTSDWNGEVITDPIEPVTITIERAGQEAKQVENVYLTEDDVAALIDNLKSDGQLYHEVRNTANSGNIKKTKPSETSETKLFEALGIDDEVKQELHMWAERQGYAKRPTSLRSWMKSKLVDAGKFTTVDKSQFKLVRELHGHDRGKYRNAAVLAVLKKHLEPSK
ncbi:hypothetical protein ACETU7_06540 [Rhodococcus sp. 3Y1]